MACNDILLHLYSVFYSAINKGHPPDVYENRQRDPMLDIMHRIYNPDDSALNGIYPSNSSTHLMDFFQKTRMGRCRENGRQKKQELLETTDTVAAYHIRYMPDKVAALQEKVDASDYPSLSRYTYHS